MKRSCNPHPDWVSVLISGEEARKIIDRLGSRTAIARRLRQRLSEDSTQRAEAFRDAAHAAYHRDGEIEIDNGAPVSEGEDGAYVNAWVWVPNETILTPDEVASRKRNRRS